MTSVNISTTNNTVTVNEGDASVVTVATQGPAGPAFTTSGATLDDTAKVNNSIVYFNQSSGTFKADATRTVENLVDGGNF
tara:strand:- start:658 stop:897 length:240 start_codon:yes stop_codon:yes gene_type:complete